MINVVIASPFREEAKQKIMEAGGEACAFTELGVSTPAEDAARIMADAEVIIGFVRPELFSHAGRLKLLQATWAGVDAIAGAVPQDVTITNASGAFGPVIAEHIIACSMALARHIPAYSRQKRWKDLGCELTFEGKRALILGAGDIGLCTARRLKPFGMTTVGIRRVPRDIPDCFDEMYTLAELDEQLALADFVLCALPGTKETAGLLNERRLRLMKKSAVLVNVGRGSLIDTSALERVMGEGHLFGAALDVTSPEPLPESSPLWDMDNVIITPHVAGIGFDRLPETEAKIADICCENLRRYIRGEKLINLVNRATGYRETMMKD
ncbi:MAG: D-2-hydroxyacid dehydrogenase [Clostridiales bacterium]|nr:D-2-hydroxyacid dehydrogenase [Clostridiales bacterium]